MDMYHIRRLKSLINVVSVKIFRILNRYLAKLLTEIKRPSRIGILFYLFTGKHDLFLFIVLHFPILLAKSC